MDIESVITGMDVYQSTDYHPETGSTVRTIWVDPVDAANLRIRVQERYDATTSGYSRGLRFRMAELAAEIQDEVDAWHHACSPCGIHLHPRPQAVCGVCR